MSSMIFAIAIAGVFPFLAAHDAGRSIDLEEAKLFVPARLEPRDGAVDVILHLHGAEKTVEPALVATPWNAVLIEFNRKGLSSVYTRPFRERELFPRLLDKALKALEQEGIVEKPKWGRVIVSSFSAGFGGVREMLKVPEHFERIDVIIMADSIYAGYRDNLKEHGVDPALMEGFAKFAQAAAEGKKTFLLTHSAQVPDGYASTTETADYLIDAVKADSGPTPSGFAAPWEPTRRAARGRFEVLGFPGVEGEDHLRHLRQIDRLWMRAFPLAAPSSHKK